MVSLALREETTFMVEIDQGGALSEGPTPVDGGEEGEGEGALDAFEWPITCRSSRHVRYILYFGVVFFACAGVGVMALAFSAEARMRWFLFVCGSASVGFSAFTVAVLVRARLVLGRDELTLFGIRTTQVVQRHALEGYRARDTGSGLLIELCPFRGKKVTLALTAEQNEAILAWISPLVDLDQRDAQRELEMIAARGGTSTLELDRRLAFVRRYSRVVDGAAMASGVWVLLWPHPYVLATVTCALMPWLAFGGIAATRGLIRLEPSRASARPGLGRAVLVPAFALALEATRGFQVLDYSALGLGAVVVAALAGLACTRATGLPFREAATYVALFAVCYGPGATALGNALLPNGPAERYMTHVHDMRVRTAKPTGYELALDPFGPIEESIEVDVDPAFYRTLEPGESVRVFIHPGALGMRWISVEAE